MAGIEFVVARIFKLARPGLVSVRLGGRTLAVETFGVKAREADQRIALGAAIDGGKFLVPPASAPRSARSRLRRRARPDRRRRSAPARSVAARRLRPPCAAAARGEPGRSCSGALINWLRAKALVSSVGSCPASAVIETSTARATHHGEATERAHPIRERPIREASARV